MGSINYSNKCILFCRLSYPQTSTISNIMSMSENMKQPSGSRRKKSTRKSRKGKQRKAKQLSQEDLDFLKKNTKYDEAEIREWYKGFKIDCPNGQLTKEKVLDMYSMILPVANAKVFVDHIFRIFDKDGNGDIDFKEFMMATDDSIGLT